MRKNMGSVDTSTVVLIGALGIGAYLVYTYFPNLFGSNADNTANNLAITQGNSAALQTDIQQQNAAGGIQTLGNAEASGIASQLYSLGISGNPVSQANQDQMVRLIIQVNTPLDLLAIENYFQTKEANTGFSLSNIFGSNNTAYTLASWLGATLDPTHLATVNNYLSAQGISQFF